MIINGARFRLISGCFLGFYLTTVSGCRSADSVPVAPAELPASQPAPPPQAPPQSTESIENALSEPEAQSFRRGETAWANGFGGELIAGVDGELYEPYSSTTIKRVQRALKNRDLYPGPISGVLDAPTMKAIYTFQQAVYSLQLCGVPTPRTRWILEQGSHTDPAS